jgi:serine/threonine protein kinase
VSDETIIGGSGSAAADLDEKVLTEAVRRGLITAPQGSNALEEARIRRVPILQVLRDRGLVAEEAAKDLDEDTREDFVPGYRVLSKLGEGGMGVVYKALQKRLDRVVALKVVMPRLAADPSYLRRFEREAKSVARLNHPSIVAAYDYGESGGRVFLAMEFVEGVNCADWMRKHGVMEEDRALALARDLSAGLAHACAAGIIHRDIKPGNILLASRRAGDTTAGTTESGAKLTDLGLARSGDAAQSGATELTAAGAILGTPGYMAPEQAFGKPVDHRADIYALGATIYQLITGQRPFEATTPIAVLARQQSDRLADPRDLRPGLSEGFVALLQGMLARDPGTRYPDYRELLTDIDRVRGGARPSLAEPPLESRTIAAPGNPSAAAPPPPATVELPSSRPAAPPTVPSAAPAAAPPPARSRAPLFAAAAIAAAGIAAFVAFRPKGEAPSAPPGPSAPQPAPAPAPVDPPANPPTDPAVGNDLDDAEKDLEAGSEEGFKRLFALKRRIDGMHPAKHRNLGRKFTERYEAALARARGTVEKELQALYDRGEYGRAYDRGVWFRNEMGSDAGEKVEAMVQKIAALGARKDEERAALGRAREAKRRDDRRGVLDALDGFEARYDFSPSLDEVKALRAWGEAGQPARAPDPAPAVRLVPDGDPRPLWTGAALGAWSPAGGEWGVSDPERKGWIEGKEAPEPVAHLRGKRDVLGRARLDLARRTEGAAGWRLEWQMLGESRRTGAVVRTEVQFAVASDGAALVLGIDDQGAYLGTRDAAAGTLERTHRLPSVEPGARHAFAVDNHGDVFVATVDGRPLGAVKVPAGLAPQGTIHAAVEGGVGYFSDIALTRLKRP